MNNINNIKLIMALAITSAVFAGGNVYAELNEPVLNLESETITVDGTILSGKEGRIVDILVTNPGYSDSDIGDKNSIQYKSSAKTTENGYFLFSIGINSGLLPVDEDNNPVAGELTVYVGGDEGRFDAKTVYFAPVGVRNKAIEEINNASDKVSLAEILEKQKKVLGIDNELFESVEKNAIADVLFDNLSNITIDESNVQDVVMEYVVLAAFNEGKKAILFENGKFKYENIMGFDTFDKDNNCTLMEIFNEGIKSEGREKVVEGMLEKNVKTIDELRKLFALEITLNVSANTSKGYGIIENTLTENNAKLVDGLDLTMFFASNTKEVAREMLGKNFNSLSEFQTELDNLSKKHKQQTSVGNTSGGGNSGNGSGGMGSAPGIYQIPVIAEQPTNDEKEIFNDISGVSWAHEAIYALFQKGVINGMGEGKFNPNQTLTREQLAKIICLGFEISDAEITGNNFKDVKNGEWYYKSVDTLYNSGIMKGVSDNLFGTGREVTRQDIAVVISRLISNGEKSKTTKEFKDNNEISEYARNAVDFLVEKGIINGFEDGSFRPKMACTRAQAVKIIYEALNVR